jgi:hypothetical protein
MNRIFFRLGLGLITLTQLAVATSWADSAPDCPDFNGGSVAVNNQQVLQWETTTANQYTSRGHVSGNIVELYPDRNGHEHFAIQIGPNAGDRIEIVYNQDFGAVPAPRVGDQVEACGDYITSTAQSGPYPPSPDNAIVHWVHSSPNPSRHPSGFMMINGTVFGGDTADAGPKEFPNQNSNSNNCSRRHHNC